MSPAKSPKGKASGPRRKRRERRVEQVRRRARRCPRRSRRSPTTRSCRTVTQARSSLRTGASTGCACRGSMRRACSATLLDRQAGSFRLAPFGINVPSARIYEPGTNILLTTWKTPTGWVHRARRADHGPRRGVDTVTPHTRPPIDEDARPFPRAHGALPGGRSRDGTDVRARVRLRARARRLVCGRRGPSADATGADTTIRLQTDMAVGVEGDWVRARHVLKKASSSTARCPGRRSSPRRRRRRGDEPSGRDREFLAPLAGARAHARPSLARPDPALGARRSRA